ncbi:MAG: hypothetical protein UW71_C0013G0006 [Parcubacteria group bacterium GW2011_GWB1_44_7]|nr:MAG: hypothetical protein UW71_C0013G0006 [Parcubacteria group bacterium GW2011_GWB1_44_7]
MGKNMIDFSYGSIVSRPRRISLGLAMLVYGRLGKWYTSGLQNRIRGFDSSIARKFGGLAKPKFPVQFGMDPPKLN